jgi:uncharacterized repeat protein (TIGR03803 family)
MGAEDGGNPLSSLIFDQSGNLYGTAAGGGAHHSGVVFELTPYSDGTWTESVLYTFTGGKDGSNPAANLIFDQSGNLYGTADGGTHFMGVVYKLAPNADGSWKESVLHSFCSLANCKDGAFPTAGLIFDQTGNLYSTTRFGGAGKGTVFKLRPNADGSWKESVLLSFKFRNQGESPYAALIFDQVGNLYGTTQGGGHYGYGTVFKLSPNGNGGWNESVLHQFSNHPEGGPTAGLIFNAAGNLYGTTRGDGSFTFGSVFEVTP